MKVLVDENVEHERRRFCVRVAATAVCFRCATPGPAGGSLPAFPN
jgi:hypothetical protein